MTDRVQACRACKAPVVFLATKAGKSMPVDAATVVDGDSVFDGTKHMSHFATCPQAAKFRKKR